MSLVEAQQLPERRASPAVTGINNPFRKSQGSPLFPPTQSTAIPAFPPITNPKNPFADTTEMATSSESRPSSRLTDEQLLMKELKISDNSSQPENRRPQQGAPNGTKPSSRMDISNIFADPPVRRPASHRPRRNSDGSIVDRKQLSPEEEKKRRERRRRERGSKSRDEKDSKDGKDSKDSKDGKESKDSKDRPIKVTNRRMDVIDKLDVTSIFGTGAFHHDGPFDACNPHRNRKGSSRAPMAAFPKDSANNALGGSGPLKKNIDLDQYHGRLPDGFADFSAPAGRKNSSNQMEPFAGYPPRMNANAKRESVLNTNSKIEPVHGDESLGLGTSTFLEGTPAPRAVIERRESERRESEVEENSGLTRKRSLAQKIRGVSNSRGVRPQDVNSPGPRWMEQTNSPDAIQVQSAGGLAKINERDPFFQDYEGAYEKKGNSIKVAEAQRQDMEPLRTSGSDKRPSGDELYRTNTETSNSAALGEDGKAGGGFLNRVKSLRSKTRPQRKD